MKVLIPRKEVREEFAFCPDCDRFVTKWRESQKKKSFILFFCKHCDRNYYPEEVLLLPEGVRYTDDMEPSRVPNGETGRTASLEGQDSSIGVN